MKVGARWNQDIAILITGALGNMAFGFLLQTVGSTWLFARWNPRTLLLAVLFALRIEPTADSMFLACQPLQDVFRLSLKRLRLVLQGEPTAVHEQHSHSQNAD